MCPRPQPGFVSRPRLVEALGEGLARGRLLVCAPAGFGKTALLADWARGNGRPVAWLGLDGGDSDPARFWRYVVAALDRARPGLAARVGPPPPRSFEGLVTVLINELAADPGLDEVLLVLDDYHLVDSGPVHESVTFLLENLPPGLRVVVSGRASPPLPLARLRARGQLAELRAAELRFTPEEAAAMLGEAAGAALPPRRWGRWWPARRGGRRGCSWPPCRCGGRRIRPDLRRRSAAATASCWTT
jgi:LuxR family maltose regulon positive regulatory protein